MSYSRLGRNSPHRRAMLRNLVTSFLASGRIETTETRAGELSSIAEHMITLAKKGDLHSKKQVIHYLMDEDVAKKLFDTIAPRYNDRAGGYTRVLKTQPRRGDAAPMAIIELV